MNYPEAQNVQHDIILLIWHSVGMQRESMRHVW